MGRDLVAEYDSRYPGVDVPPEQKEERMQRLAFKEERGSLRRTNRNRGVVVPALPVDEDGRLRP